MPQAVHSARHRADRSSALRVGVFNVRVLAPAGFGARAQALRVRPRYLRPCELCELCELCEHECGNPDEIKAGLAAVLIK
jgi:hypothetical protein